ncbi:hypothetical protein BpHYR1_045287 [Brachionus plicatilis]|uniref:Uncharacterized protein n=1 Tax=Brachionus plicatilis TaxID=10195 RepID=A0A3M7SMZ8_BRAPC|nr:hypothetical protein BpHYR1_045287 [Brachionus plicatilis]
MINQIKNGKQNIYYKYQPNGKFERKERPSPILAYFTFNPKFLFEFKLIKGLVIFNTLPSNKKPITLRTTAAHRCETLIKTKINKGCLYFSNIQKEKTPEFLKK